MGGLIINNKFTMKKYLIGTSVGLLLAIAIMPVMASADTIGDLQSQIKALMDQIKALQEKVVTLRQASTTEMMNGEGKKIGQMMGKVNGNDMMPPACPQLNRNLGIGSRGDDVKEIQMMLAKDSSIYEGEATGYYGQQTAKAMAKFHAQYGIASSSTGIVGPMTREFFGKKCGWILGVGNPDGEQQKVNLGVVMPGIVTSNDGTTLSFSTKDGEVKSVQIASTTVFQKWIATSTPPTTVTSSDAVVGSQIVVEGKELSKGVITAMVVKIGFPMMIKVDIKENQNGVGSQLRVRGSEDQKDYQPMMNR